MTLPVGRGGGTVMTGAGCGPVFSSWSLVRKTSSVRCGEGAMYRIVSGAVAGAGAGGRRKACRLEREGRRQ